MLKVERCPGLVWFDLACYGMMGGWLTDRRNECWRCADDPEECWCLTCCCTSGTSARTRTSTCSNTTNNMSVNTTYKIQNSGYNYYFHIANAQEQKNWEQMQIWNTCVFLLIFIQQSAYMIFLRILNNYSGFLDTVDDLKEFWGILLDIRDLYGFFGIHRDLQPAALWVCFHTDKSARSMTFCNSAYSAAQAGQMCNKGRSACSVHIKIRPIS